MARLLGITNKQDRISVHGPAAVPRWSLSTDVGVWWMHEPAAPEGSCIHQAKPFPTIPALPQSCR